jgi:hypothetical protein
MLQPDCPVPEHAGPGFSCPRINLDGVALPLSDHLIVVAPNGRVVALNPGGRRLWEALQAGCTVDDLVEASVQEGDLPEDAARSRISRALASWRALGLIDAAAREIEPSPLASPVLPRPTSRTWQLDEIYLPGDRPVRVRCDDRVLAGVIQAACGSCRFGDAAGAVATVDVTQQDGGFAVGAEDVVLARADDLTPNPALARHRCLTALLESSRQPRRWLGILHASAVGAGGRCVIFPGEKGAGKSTFGAALVAAGAKFVTDDYAPLEQATWLVWPVPYAPGIKRGSWRSLRRRYPGLLSLPVHRLAGLQIRYLDLETAHMAPLDRGLSVGAMVFPRYEAGAKLKHQRLTPAEAMAGLCHARSLLERRPEVVAETLRWVESVPAYRLTYGDLDGAIEWVWSLLDAT